MSDPAVPLGHTRCAHCAALSPLYALWPNCRECEEPTCPACAVPQSQQEHDYDIGNEATHRISVQCRACYAADPAICLFCNAKLDADHAQSNFCDVTCQVHAEASL